MSIKDRIRNATELADGRIFSMHIALLWELKPLVASHDRLLEALKEAIVYPHVPSYDDVISEAEKL